jgi:hypothetical protein
VGIQETSAEGAAAKRIARLIEKIKERIARVDLACSGTLIKRMKVCGKPGCKCAADPNARHGPYYEWSRREGKRLLHSVVSAAEANDLKKAIANYRNVQRLLKRWEAQSVELIRSKHPQSSRRNRG